MAARKDDAFKISSYRVRRSRKGAGVVLDASNEGMATRGYASEQLTVLEEIEEARGAAETPNRRRLRVVAMEGHTL